MKEVFEKILKKLSEAGGCDADCEYGRGWDEAIGEAIETVKQVAAECSNGHFGCNTNGEHERCYGCGLMDCKNRNRIWFGAVDDDTDTNVGNNGWIPVLERLPDEAFGCLVTVMDCDPLTQTDFENILPYFVGYDGHGWNDSDGEEIPFEVVAWQPLPEPYQPKGE